LALKRSLKAEKHFVIVPIVVEVQPVPVAQRVIVVPGVQGEGGTLPLRDAQTQRRWMLVGRYELAGV
jgi:hypothetical protein